MAPLTLAKKPKMTDKDVNAAKEKLRSTSKGGVSVLGSSGNSGPVSPGISSPQGKGIGGSSSSSYKGLASAGKSTTSSSTMASKNPFARLKAWSKERDAKKQKAAQDKAAFKATYTKAKDPAFKEHAAKNQSIFDSEEAQTAKEKKRNEEYSFLKSPGQMKEFVGKAQKSTKLSSPGGKGGLGGSKPDIDSGVQSLVGIHGVGEKKSDLDKNQENIGYVDTATSKIGTATGLGGALASGSEALSKVHSGPLGGIGSSMNVSELGVSINGEITPVIGLAGSINSLLSTILSRFTNDKGLSAEQQQDLDLQLATQVMSLSGSLGNVGKGAMTIAEYAGHFGSSSNLVAAGLPGIGIAIAASQLLANSIELGRQAGLVHVSRTNVNSLEKMVHKPEHAGIMGDISVLKGATSHFKMGAVSLLVKAVFKVLANVVSLLGAGLSTAGAGTPIHAAGAGLGVVATALSTAVTIAGTIEQNAKAYEVKNLRKKYSGGDHAVSELLIKKDPKHSAQTLINYAKGVHPDPTKQVDDKLKTHAIEQLKALGVGTHELGTLGDNELRELAVKRVGESQTPKTMLDSIKDLGSKIKNSNLHYSGKWQEIQNLREIKNKLGYGGVEDRGGHWARISWMFSGKDSISSQQSKMRFLIEQAHLSDSEKAALLDLLPKVQGASKSGGSATTGTTSTPPDPSSLAPVNKALTDLTISGHRK